MLRLCFLWQGDIKTYRWKPYVNKVSVVATVAFSDFLLLDPERPFPLSPQKLFPNQQWQGKTLAYSRLMESDYFNEGRFLFFHLFLFF